MRFLKRKSVIVLGALIFVIVFMLFQNFRVVNTQYTHSDRKIPESFDGYKICVVADFHNQPNYKNVIKAVKKSAPDIICIAGDLISMRTKNYSNTEKLIEGLEKIAPIYSVNGNQEYYNATYLGEEKPVLQKILAGHNVTFMDDKAVTIEKDGELVNLIGADDSIYEDSTTHHQIKTEKFLSYMDKKMDKTVFSVLLAHRPQYFNIYSKYNYDLILAGHLHGGVINIPWIKREILMSKSGTDLYDKGIYENNNSTMIVSGGIGTTHFIPRLFNTPEVVTITLKSE